VKGPHEPSYAAHPTLTPKGYVEARPDDGSLGQVLHVLYGPLRVSDSKLPMAETGLWSLGNGLST
jgi:hypothetical protein